MSFKVVLPSRDKKKIPLTFFDRFTSAAFRLFSRPATRLTRSIPLLRDDILKSNLRITPEGLVSVAFLSALIAAVASAVGTYVAVTRLGSLWFLGVIIAIPFVIMVFTLVINSPKISASNRAASIDTELPFVIGYMSVLAGGVKLNTVLRYECLNWRTMPCPAPVPTGSAKKRRRKSSRCSTAGGCRATATGRPAVPAQVLRFEEEFAEYIGVRHAVATSSGTAACSFRTWSTG